MAVLTQHGHCESFLGEPGGARAAIHITAPLGVSVPLTELGRTGSYLRMTPTPPCPAKDYGTVWKLTRERSLLRGRLDSRRVH